MIIRAQLFGPDNHIVPDSQYNELFTMHGTIMLLLFARGRRVQVPPITRFDGVRCGLGMCDAGTHPDLAAPADEVERWMVPCMGASAVLRLPRRHRGRRPGMALDRPRVDPAGQPARSRPTDVVVRASHRTLVEIVHLSVQER